MRVQESIVHQVGPVQLRSTSLPSAAKAAAFRSVNCARKGPHMPACHDYESGRHHNIRTLMPIMMRTTVFSGEE